MARAMSRKGRWRQGGSTGRTEMGMGRWGGWQRGGGDGKDSEEGNGKGETGRGH